MTAAFPAPPGDVHGRRDPAWCTPDRLPASLLAFDTPIPALPVGRAGKVGLLELGFAPVAGRSRLVHQYQQTPLYLLRPLHLDPHRPDMAFAYLQQSGDGLVQGDRYRIDIDVAPEAAVHVTTQTPTKVYGMRENFATHLVNLRVGAGSVLEYLPDPVVPFGGSRFFSRTLVDAHPDAVAVLGEVLLPGRVAHGEAHAYDFCRTETEVRDPAGALLVADQLELESAADAPRPSGRLGPFDAVATLYVLARGPLLHGLTDRIHTALSCFSDSDVASGVSDLPHGAGIGVRLLASSSVQAVAALGTAWQASRMQLLGAPAPDLRKG